MGENGNQHCMSLWWIMCYYQTMLQWTQKKLYTHPYTKVQKGNNRTEQKDTLKIKGETAHAGDYSEIFGEVNKLLLQHTKSSTHRVNMDGSSFFWLGHKTEIVFRESKRDSGFIFFWNFSKWYICGTGTTHFQKLLARLMN